MEKHLTDDNLNNTFDLNELQIESRLIEYYGINRT